MGFDEKISEWILEYLLREVTDTTLITQALSVLPVPETSPVLIKTISLKTLDSFILDGSVSESILDILERFAKICSDDEDGVVFLDESIKLAYCMVAVDCTVRFNEGTGSGGGGLYLEAVKRIWRGRIGYLEKSSYADLIISDQLRTWGDDIEAAVYDDCVSKRIVAINTRLEALKALKLFIAEAWKLMDSTPTFLELVAKKMGRSLLVSQNLSDRENCKPVQEETPCVSDMHNLVGERVVEKATDTLCIDLPDTLVPVHIERDKTPVEQTATNSPCLSDMHNLAGECVVEKATDTLCIKLPDTPVPIHIERDKAPVQQTAADSPLEPPVMKRNHQYEDGSAYCQDRDGSSKPAMQIENQLDQRNVRHREPTMQIEIQPDQRNVRHRDQKVKENTVAVPVPALRHKEVENSNALPKPKPAAGKSKRSKRGVQIGDAEDLTCETLRNRVTLLGSAEVSKVQEALRSSTLGLQAVVMDPLPEALGLADAVISDFGRNPTTAEPSAETQDGMHINMPNHSNAQYAEADHSKENSIPGPSSRPQNDDKRDESHVDARATRSFVRNNSKVIDGTRDNIETKQSCPEINATRGGFMSRNGTAQTYEWEDVDDLDRREGPSSSKRLKLPRPKPITVSPLKMYVGRRRSNKRWRSEEEDALRSGVEKFGKGSWKVILCAYGEIFEERTEVDLKDKWRNMMKRAA